MKVIKHGDLYREKEIKCKKCNALLLYCSKDIKTRSTCEEVLGGFHNSYREYIVCPECNCQINLSWIIDGKETVKGGT